MDRENDKTTYEKNLLRYPKKKWLTAWSLSRELPLPITFKSGFKVETDDVKQKKYLFPEHNDFIELSNTVN
ncbi:hypothetical protein [Flavobacterium lindanitolerans]|nr:hypothetical protein [Flavobacterium lindanitolerans]